MDSIIFHFKMDLWSQMPLCVTFIECFVNKIKLTEVWLWEMCDLRTLDSSLCMPVSLPPAARQKHAASCEHLLMYEVGNIAAGCSISLFDKFDQWVDFHNSWCQYATITSFEAPKTSHKTCSSSATCYLFKCDFITGGFPSASYVIIWGYCSGEVKKIVSSSNTSSLSSA